MNDGTGGHMKVGHICTICDHTTYVMRTVKTTAHQAQVEHSVRDIVIIHVT